MTYTTKLPQRLSYESIRPFFHYEELNRARSSPDFGPERLAAEIMFAQLKLFSPIVAVCISRTLTTYIGPSISKRYVHHFADEQRLEEGALGHTADGAYLISDERILKEFPLNHCVFISSSGKAMWWKRDARAPLDLKNVFKDLYD